MSITQVNKPLLSDQESGSTQSVQQSKISNSPKCVRVATTALVFFTGALALITKFKGCKDLSNDECEEKYGFLKPAVATCFFSATAGLANEVFRCCFRGSN